MVLRFNRPARFLATSIPMLLVLACSSDEVPADETGTTGSASDTTIGSTPSADSTNVTAATTGTGPAGSDDTATTSPTSETGTENTGSEDTGNEDTGSAGSGSTSGSTGGEDASSGTSTGAPDNGAPVILSLSVLPGTLEGAGTVVVTAVATDPDGIADLIGGVITTPDGTAYGALASAADEGAYEIELSWDDFNQAQSIDLPPYESSSRDLHVEFFDQAGASGEGVVSVILEASVDGFAVCDGTSVSWQSDTNCGACGFSCLDLPETTVNATCLNDSPEDDSGCFSEGLAHTNNPATTCAAACANSAGPFASYTGVVGCYFQSVGVDCAEVHPADCPGTSLDNPPLGCTPEPSSSLWCECQAVFEP